MTSDHRFGPISNSNVALLYCSPEKTFARTSGLVILIILLDGDIDYASKQARSAYNSWAATTTFAGHRERVENRMIFMMVIIESLVMFD